MALWRSNCGAAQLELAMTALGAVCNVNTHEGSGKRRAPTERVLPDIGSVKGPNTRSVVVGVPLGVEDHTQGLGDPASISKGGALR